MGNRTFIIMLSACLVQVLVVSGTVTYMALRDSGATEVVEAESALASECEEYGQGDDGDGSYLYPASSTQDTAGVTDACEIDDVPGKTPELEQSGGYAD